MIRSLVTAAMLVVAAPPPGNWAYSDADVRTPSPGDGWNLQTEVPGAPNIRAAFVKVRGKDLGSILNIALDGSPDVPTPQEYAKRTLAQLGTLGFKVRRTGEFTWKGNPAARAEYTDAAGKKFFAQATIRTPRGGFLVVTLQSPDAQSYGEDLKALFPFLDRIEVAPADAPKATP